MGLLFSIAVGSEGTGESRYVLYLPFVLAPGATLAGLDRMASVGVASHTLTLEKLERHYAISVGPFFSREEAASYFPRLRGSLLWLSLKFNLGIGASKVLSEVALYENPIPISKDSSIAEIYPNDWGVIDGEYDSDKAVIRPEHRKLS